MPECHGGIGPDVEVVVRQYREGGDWLVFALGHGVEARTRERAIALLRGRLERDVRLGERAKRALEKLSELGEVE